MSKHNHTPIADTPIADETAVDKAVADNAVAVVAEVIAEQVPVKSPTILDRVHELELAEHNEMSQATSHTQMKEVINKYLAKFEEVELDVKREALFNAVQVAKANLEKVHIELRGRWYIDADSDDYAIGITKSITTSKTGGTTRKIGVSKDNISLGEFSNAKLACEHLNIEVGNDSGVRVLQRNGYTITLIGG